jgi:RNA polymerase sigma-70 factor (ECF subfamily)
MPEKASDYKGIADEELVTQALNGEKSAFRELFERYRTRAYRVAYRFLGNHEDALDVVQDSFVKTYKGLDGFEQRSQFRTWLMRIVTNTCLDRRRSRSSSQATPLSPEIAETTDEASQPHHRPERPLEKMEFGELRKALNDALASLSDAHRTVFILHTEEDLTYREIADALEISEGTVMSRLYHARKNLQKMLGNKGLI